MHVQLEGAAPRLITAAQTLAQSDILASLLYSGKRWRHGVHLYMSMAETAPQTESSVAVIIHGAVLQCSFVLRMYLL